MHNKIQFTLKKEINNSIDTAVMANVNMYLNLSRWSSGQHV